MGKYQKTIVAKADAVSIDDAATSHEVALPLANFIDKVTIILQGTGGSGTVDIENIIKSVSIIASSNSAIVSTAPSGGNRQMRDIYQFRNNGVRSTLKETTDGDSKVITAIMMGRVKHDPLVTLPAFLFSSLTLKVTFDTLIATTAFATGTVKMTVIVEEYVDPELAANEDKLAELFIQRYNDLEGAVATKASGDYPFDLNLGELLMAGLYCYATGTAGTTVSKFVLNINNGSLIPITTTWDELVDENKTDLGIASAITGAVFISLDNPKTVGIIGEAMNMSKAARVNAASLVETQGASGQTSEVVQISYVPVANLLVR